MSPSQLERCWFGARAPEDETVVVMLHHGLGSLSTWKDFPDRIKAVTGLPVMAYSRFGHGKSPPTDPVSQVDFMQEAAHGELHTILSEEGIGRPMLVGHSDGGSIAAIYAGTLGRDVTRGCVLLAPHVFVESCTVEGAQAARRDYQFGALRERLAAHHDHPDGVFWRWNRSWLDSGFRQWNIEREVSGIECPVTVVQGLDDPYGTVAQADRIAAALPQPPDVILLQGCGHEPHRDRPLDVLDAIGGMAREMRNP